MSRYAKLLDACLGPSQWRIWTVTASSRPVARAIQLQHIHRTSRMTAQDPPTISARAQQRRGNDHADERAVKNSISAPIRPSRSFPSPPPTDAERQMSKRVERCEQSPLYPRSGRGVVRALCHQCVRPYTERIANMHVRSLSLIRTTEHHDTRAQQRGCNAEHMGVMLCIMVAMRCYMAQKAPRCARKNHSLHRPVFVDLNLGNFCCSWHVVQGCLAGRHFISYSICSCRSAVSLFICTKCETGDDG